MCESKSKVPGGDALTPILFYSSRVGFAEFSNFYKAKFILDDLVWDTVEHYYQAQKFLKDPALKDRVHAERVRAAPTAAAAKALGRGRKINILKWDEIKLDTMRIALHAKFTQNPMSYKLLCGTGSRPLVEDSPRDYYWGRGRAARVKTC